MLQDELIWGASWLYKATKAPNYWNYVKNHINYLESNNIVVRNVNGNPVPSSQAGSISEFGWDAKHAGINILVSQVSLSFSN